MDFTFISEYYPLFLVGIKYTIGLSFFSVLIGLVIGFAVALMRVSKSKILKFISCAYVEFLRGTPLMVQLFIIYFGLPSIGINFPDIQMFGIDFPAVLSGIIALSINSSAYVAEIIRGGINSIDKGQMEAANALGMPYYIAMKNIIIPQAFKNMLPALGNEFITIIKESSIVSIVGIPEIMYNCDIVRANTYKGMEPLLVAALIYFVITFTLSKIISYFEGRMSTCD